MRSALWPPLAAHALGCAAGVHKRAPSQHDQWVRGARARPDTVVPVQILFAEDGVDEAASELLALADPESRSFGKYWSAQSVTSAFSLSDKDIVTILEWAQRSTGLPSSTIEVSPCRCRANFNATVRQLEALLDAEYFVYKHKRPADTALVCDEYNVPDAVSPLIDFIIPTVFLLPGHAQWVAPSNLVLDSTEV
ncbi:hypothetical protein OQA88_10606 [Cercophora sp. LCS_1]